MAYSPCGSRISCPTGGSPAARRRSETAKTRAATVFIVFDLPILVMPNIPVLFPMKSYTLTSTGMSSCLAIMVRRRVEEYRIAPTRTISTGSSVGLM